ncbi:MAG TPA: glycosyltransferase [Candidatus Nanoarchaeia archaeon]|nr:glycosyltransferase [Candidatus Nanoarchaeia archaeon]
MNVLHFITGLNYGGAEHMMYKTIEHLDRSRYNIFVASLVGGTLEPELREKYPVFVLNAAKVFAFPFALFKLRNIIKKEKVDLVHSYLFHANILARFAAIGTGAKVVSSIRIKEVEKKSHNIIDAWTSFLVDKYTCVSDSVRDFVICKEKISPEKIVTVPNGLDFSRFAFTIDAEKKIKDLEFKRPVIVSVANLRNSKDYPTLFKALSIVLRTKNVHLLVVGKGECEQEYKKIAHELGIDAHIRFLGFRGDALELIAASDLCVLSTFYEGQSNSLLEYMAFKKPIIATDIDENREVITNGTEGLLVPAQHPEKMAEAILRVLNDAKLRKTLGMNAYARVCKDHNIIRVAKQTEQLYEEMMS